MKVRGKVAVVTGGGRGIGRAIVERLALEGAGVAVVDLDPASAEETARLACASGVPARAFACDVADTSQVYACVQAIAAAFGRMDVLVNNAGWDKVEPFVESEAATWDRVIAINFRGPVTLAHAVLPHFIAQKSGAIISIASDAGRVGSTGEVVYSGAKGGVIAFSKALAREVARHGITVNTVCPGPTLTPALESLAEKNPKLVESLTRSIPFGRLARPEEVAASVVFLASDDARYITGQTLSVNGGLTMV